MTGNIRIRFSTGDGEVEDVFHEACRAALKNRRYEVRRLEDGAFIASYHEDVVLALQVTE